MRLDPNRRQFLKKCDKNGCREYVGLVIILGLQQQQAKS